MCKPERMTYTTTLQPHGDEHALIIDKALQDALGITPDTPLQLTISGNTLIVTPTNVGVSEERIDEIFDKLLPKYDGMLRNLAQ